MIVSPGIKTGIDIRLTILLQLGAICWWRGRAAVAQYGVPCIIWDLGTATTVSVVDGERHSCGGAITAGVGVSIEALVSARPSCRKSVSKPAACCGTNTVLVHAVRSSTYGAASMIDGMSDRITEELGWRGSRCNHRRAGAEIADCCRRKAIYDDNLL